MLMGVLCRFLLSELVIRRLFCPPTYYGFGRYLIFFIFFTSTYFVARKYYTPKYVNPRQNCPPFLLHLLQIVYTCAVDDKYQVWAGHSPFPLWWHHWWVVGMTVRWYDDIIGGRCEDDCSSQRARRYLNLGWESLPRKTSNGLPYLRQRLAYTILISSKPSSASLSSCPSVGCHSGSWNWGQLG